MANPVFKSVVSTLSVYIGEPKAITTLQRQLQRCSASEDTLTKGQLNEMMNYLVGASAMWLGGDKAKAAEMTQKLKALA